LTLIVPYFTKFMNANERPRILQGIALIEDASFAIDGPSAKGIDPGIDVSRGQEDGRLYPNKPPGAGLVAALAYFGVGDLGDGRNLMLRRVTWAARVLGGVLPTLWIVILALRRLAEPFGRSQVRVALVLYVLATPVLSYGRLLFAHQLAAAFLFQGVVWLVDAASSEAPKWKGPAAGLFAATAIGMEYTAAFAGIPMAIFAILRVGADRGLAGRIGHLAACLAGACIPLIALAAYHDHAFGSPWTTPYHVVTRAEFAEIHGRGLLGLSLPTGHSLFEHVFSPWGGLLWWFPLALLLPLGWSSAKREVLRRWARNALGLGTAIFAIALLVNLGLAQSGGWRVGPRYLVFATPMALPLLALLVGHAVQRPLLWSVLVALGLWTTWCGALAAQIFPHLPPDGNPVWDLPDLSGVRIG
jgi:hypothetical protein